MNVLTVEGVVTERASRKLDNKGERFKLAIHEAIVAFDPSLGRYFGAYATPAGKELLACLMTEEYKWPERLLDRERKAEITKLFAAIDREGVANG